MMRIEKPDIFELHSVDLLNLANVLRLNKSQWSDTLQCVVTIKDEEGEDVRKHLFEDDALINRMLMYHYNKEYIFNLDKTKQYLNPDIVTIKEILQYYFIPAWEDYKNKNIYNWGRAYDALLKYYNPIENYDRYEESTLTYNGEEKNKLQHKGKESDTLTFTGSESDKVSYSGSESDKVTYSGSESDKVTYSGTEKDTLEMQGKEKDTLSKNGTETVTSTDSGSEKLERDYEGSEKVENSKEGSEKSTHAYDTRTATSESGRSAVNTATWTDTEGHTHFNHIGLNQNETSYITEGNEKYSPVEKTITHEKDREDSDTLSFTNRKDVSETSFEDRKDSETRTFNNRKNVAATTFDDRSDVNEKEFTNRKDVNLKEFTNRNDESVKTFTNRNDESVKTFTNRNDESVKTFTNRQNKNEKTFENREDEEIRSFLNRFDKNISHIHGNIGVTTSSAMVSELVEQRLHNLVDMILDEFINTYCVYLDNGLL